MAADAVRAYHERTKHSFESVRRGDHYLDWSNEPTRFKEYADVAYTALPPVPRTGVPCHRALRASADPEGDHRVDAEALSHLLFHGAGLNPSPGSHGGPVRFRTYASAGALYPIEAYVVTGGGLDIEPGVAHYDPRSHALGRLRRGDVRGNLGLAGADPGQAAIVLAGLPWRTAWKYTARGFRHLYWDAGMMVANILASAAALGIRARVLLGFVDPRVEGLLGLDGRTEFPVCAVTLGPGHAPAAAETPPLHVSVAQGSSTPVDDPLIEGAHRAVSLLTEEDVRAFRSGTAPPAGTPPGTRVSVEPFPRLSSDAFEDVVRRRGSSRRLAPGPVPMAEYLALLDEALAPIPGDWGEAWEGPDAYVAAAALEGAPPGAYLVRSGEEPRLLRQGPVRGHAAYLCLEQRLGGDAAATVWFMADLDRCLEALGPRGYAAAQLDAGIRAGRLYLAAYAQCLGASGITFYDDDVRSFFGTRDEPMLAVVAGLEGHRRSLRRCREEHAGA